MESIETAFGNPEYKKLSVSWISEVEFNAAAQEWFNVLCLLGIRLEAWGKSSAECRDILTLQLPCKLCNEHVRFRNSESVELGSGTRDWPTEIMSEAEISMVTLFSLRRAKNG